MAVQPLVPAVLMSPVSTSAVSESVDVGCDEYRRKV